MNTDVTNRIYGRLGKDPEILLAEESDPAAVAEVLADVGPAWQVEVVPVPVVHPHFRAPRGGRPTKRPVTRLASHEGVTATWITPSFDLPGNALTKPRALEAAAHG